MAPCYPMDHIMESTPCELHVKVVNITMKVAVGYALPIGPNQRYHCGLVPHGYTVSGVDQVTGGFEKLKLDYPAGEGDLLEQGEAENTTVLWTNEYIVIPNWTPRSPPCHPSPSCHLYLVCQPSPPHQPSPARQPFPPPRHPSPPPRPTKDESLKWKHTITAPAMSHNQSPKCRWEPLPRVLKVPPKRAYDYT
jgi:hypothetical protein